MYYRLQTQTNNKFKIQIPKAVNVIIEPSYTSTGNQVENYFGEISRTIYCGVTAMIW